MAIEGIVNESKENRRLERASKINGFMMSHPAIWIGRMICEPGYSLRVASALPKSERYYKSEAIFAAIVLETVKSVAYVRLAYNLIN